MTGNHNVRLLADQAQTPAVPVSAAALENLGPGLIRAANGLQARVTKVLQTAPELLGPFRATLTAAMAEGDFAKGADIQAKDRLNKNAMIYAAGAGSTAVVQLLIAKGVEIELVPEVREWLAQKGLAAFAGTPSAAERAALENALVA